MKLTKPEYWNAAYESLDLAIIGESDEVRLWVERTLPKGAGEDCFELGCFPGRYLAVLGEMGYTLHGIDMTPRVEEDLPRWLSSQGYRTGSFSRGDFLSFQPQRQYQVVASFGFIEHFSDWRLILEKQCSMVAQGGYLLVEAPNFAGFIQKGLHLLLDAENMGRHNTAAMDAGAWAEVAAACGFEVCFAGYFGAFDFWADHQPRNLLQKVALKAVTSLQPKLGFLPAGVRAYAPYAGLIARKK